jgi:hypothetical protein
MAVRTDENVDESEMAGLAPEERAALEAEAGDGETGEDESPAEGGEGETPEEKLARETAEAKAAALAAAAKKAAEKVAPPEGETAEEKAAREAAELKAGTKKAAEDTAENKTVADEDEEEPFIPFYQADPVPDFAKKIEALNTRLVKAKDDFKEGKLEVDEYDAERDSIEKERVNLQGQQWKAELVEQQNAQTSDQRWAWECRAFYRQVLREEQIDYADSIRLHTRLDEEVRRLAGDPAFKDKPGRWFLDEAHKLVKKELGLIPRRDDKETPTPKPAAKPDTRKPDRSTIPKTLQGVPQAGGDDDTGNSEFAALENMEGLELEAALARLPADKAARYLRGE